MELCPLSGTWAGSRHATKTMPVAASLVRQAGDNMSGFLFGALILSVPGKMEWEEAGKQEWGVGR